MRSNCLKSNCCIYTSLIGNIIINFFFLIILLFTLYDFFVLNFYQQFYLIISILNWMFLCFYSICKFFLVILGKFTQQYSSKRIWMVAHFPGFIIIIIALLYDLVVVPQKSGLGGLIFYYLIFIFICSIFFVVSLLDLIGTREQLIISHRKIQRILLTEEKEINKTDPGSKKDN